jgi:hypothetical protein
MIVLWLEGSTPHVDAGLRIEGTLDTLIDQLMGDDRWIVVPPTGGGALNLRRDRIIAFQGED